MIFLYELGMNQVNKEGKMKGTVKFFNVQKGFGFIAGEDSKEYFVHKSGFAEDVTLKENDAVTFDVEEGDKGPKATNVQKSA